MKTAEYGDERNGVIRTMVEDYHGFAVPLPPFRAGAGEVSLDGAVVRADEEGLRLCADDLADFLSRMRSGAGGRGTGATVRLERGAVDGRPEIAVGPAGVSIRAATVRDGWQAVVWLERHMAARHAPILPAGTRVLKPVYDLRITTSIFAQPFERPDDPIAYTDRYLCGMAHLGYTAFFLYINLWDFTRSRLLPELDGPDADRQIAALRALSERARRFGLSLVLMVNAPRTPPDHAVFARHPELKGGIVMRETGHALCTSEELTHRYYAEQMARLCREAPGLGALAFLIGGEGFLHCYTRPVPRTERVTNCPRCGARKPSEVLVPLLNRVVEAVKSASPATRVMFWPYSSYIWQKEPKETYNWSEDLAVIRGLDPRATWLIEIEKDAVQEVAGVGAAAVWDYSIQYIGPSPKVELEGAALRGRGIELALKTETNISVELHAVPYLPVMNRWAARQRAMQAAGAQVAWESWRFTGFWHSPSAEVAYWMSVEPGLSDDDVLGRVAARLYGAEVAPQVLGAWRLFSEAWESFPVIYGTYFSGPLLLGPAHPLDSGLAFQAPRLWSERFYQVNPVLWETEGEKDLADPRNRTPKFLLFAEGHHAARLRDLGRTARLYAEGLALLEAAFARVPAPLQPQASLDLDLARLVHFHVEEDVAFNEFVQWRDQLRYTVPGEAAHREATARLTALLRGSIARAEQALELANRTPFAGWGYTYGTRFSAAMIEEKLRHARAWLQGMAREPRPELD